MLWLAAAITMYCADGADLATKPVPTVPPAPARFSTSTVSPRARPSSVENERARMSCTPPAAKGTTMCSILALACANTPPDAAAAAASAMLLPRNLRRSTVMDESRKQVEKKQEWRGSADADLVGQAAHETFAPGQLFQRHPFVGLVR